MKRSIAALYALVLSLCGGVATAAPVGFAEAVMAGMRLTVEEAAALEERLATDANDVRTRSQLVAYHRHHRHNALGNGVGSRSAHTGHVLWLIRNAPQTAVTGRVARADRPACRCKRLHCRQGRMGESTRKRADERRVPRSCGEFLFAVPQDRDLLVETLEKAQALDPGNAKRPTQPGHLYLRDAASAERIKSRLRLPDGFDADDPRLPSDISELLERGSSDHACMAGRALEHLRRAYDLAGSDPERTFLLDGLAAAAFRTGQYGDARIYADAMLTAPATGRNDESHIHKANIVLGRVALAEDDVVTAKRTCWRLATSREGPRWVLSATTCSSRRSSWNVASRKTYWSISNSAPSSRPETSSRIGLRWSGPVAFRTLTQT